jgi:hypothetical protein
MTIYTLLCASLLTTIAFGMYSAIFKLGAQASLPASYLPTQRQTAMAALRVIVTTSVFTRSTGLLILLPASRKFGN